MTRLSVWLLQALLQIVFVWDPLIAGNGKLSGRIYDAQTGTPVPGSVRVTGTAYGSAADSTGLYFILDIPPGTYDIRGSAVGHTPQVVRGLVIAPDNLRKLDFALQAEDIKIDEIVVQADRMAVESSQTSARTDFDDSEFRNLPLNSALDLIALSPSTFKQFIGGTLPVFSHTTIDGIDVTDQTSLWLAERWGVSPSAFNGGRDITTAQHSSFIEPNLNAIGQATLFTGTSGPDYSDAVGTLSYALQEGGRIWTGEAGVRTSQPGGLTHMGPDIYWDAAEYFNIRARLAASAAANDRKLAERCTWTPDKYSYGRRPDVAVSLAAGGPLSEDADIYLTGLWHSTADRLPNERTQRFNSSAKLTWALSPTIRLSMIGLLEDRGRLFGWKNSSYADQYRFFLEGVPLWDGVHFTGGVKWSHLLSTSTSYELQVSVVYDNVRRGFCDDNNDGVIALGEHGNFLTFSDTAQVRRYQASAINADQQKFFSAPMAGPNLSDAYVRLQTSVLAWNVARPPIYYENSTSRVVTLRGDLNSQIDRHHLLGCGAQVRLHMLDYEMRTGAIGIAGLPGNSYIEELWTRHPAELAFHLQDRMEFSGLIMNFGLRLEGLLLDAAPILDWYARPDTVVDAQGKLLLVPRRGSLLPWKWFLSPRIALSHPIGTEAAVHISYSRTCLSLPFSYLYSNYNSATRVSLFYAPAVNVDQETISATNYDLGVQWAVAPATLVGVNAYYRDYSNMYPASLSVYPSAVTSGGFYGVVTNACYSDVTGFELSLQRGLTPLGFGISAGGRIAYAYGKVKVGNPVSSNKSQFSVLGGDSAAYNGRLPFGDISLWDKSNFEVPGGPSTLTAGFDRTQRVTCGLTISFPWEIRLSGTGTFNSGFWYPERLKGGRVLSYARAPWNRRFDIRLEKSFPVSGSVHVDFFVDVLNLFNWTNILGYYDYYLADQTAWELRGDPTGGSPINRPVTFEGTMLYDIPREAYFGARIGF